MHKLLVKWRVIAAVATVAKILLMLLPPSGDLINWAGVADVILRSLYGGQLAQISAAGVYGPMGFVLLPFFWLWTKMPIAHPVSLESNNSTAILLLAILLKTPTLLADIATGVLVYKLVQLLTRSVSRSRVAFLVWYLNPFNIFLTSVFGAMDVIPTAIVMLALLLAYGEKWFHSAVWLSIAGILRLFPFFTFLFLLPAVRPKTMRGYVYLFSGFLIPISLGLIAVYATGAATLASIALTPLRQKWLLSFMGFNLPIKYVKLPFILLTAQLLISFRYWKTHNVLDLGTASVLALLLAETYEGGPHVFLWVSPLLTVSVLSNPDELWVFVFTFVSVSLYGGVVPVQFNQFTDTLVWSSFYAAKAAYLIKVNLRNIPSANMTHIIEPNITEPI